MSIAHDTLRRWLLTSGDARKQAVLATNPLAYWPLAEGSGATITDLSGNSYDGSYTGVTWDGTSSPYGKPVPNFDGSLDYGNVYSAGLASAFDFEEGTILFHAKAPWIASRYFVHLRRDANNYIFVIQSGSVDGLIFRHYCNATLKQTTPTQNMDDWHSFAFSWSIAGGGELGAGEAKAYIDGSQVGATLTSIGTATGSGLSSTETILGAQNTTPALVIDGYLAEAAVWNRPMDTDILGLM